MNYKARMKSMTVEEFTTPNPESIHKEDSLEQVWNLMVSKGIRHVLVTDDKKEIVGLISQRDLTTFSQAPNFNEMQAQDVMSEDIFSVNPETKLYEVAFKMSKNKLGSAIVKDAKSDFLGIFTATDALNALVEILRGDLEDEL